MTPLERELAMKEMRERPYGVNGIPLADLATMSVGAADKALHPLASGLQIRGMALGGPVGRLAGTSAALGALKLGTGAAALGGVMGAADVLAGSDSLANKAMDTAAMGIGGLLGAVGGPMGVAAGAGVGKMASDSLQYLFGDKKTAKQRELENALAALNAGRIG